MSIDKARDYQELLGLDFDVQALDDKYRAEREKRMRADHDRQYIKVAGDYEHYRDPVDVTESADRKSIERDVDVVVVGAGLAGLMIGAEFHKQGVKDYVVIERAADVGGNWFWNRYPGAGCDTESYIYMPLLEETGYIPKQRFCSAHEIHNHTRRIAEYFGVYDRALFNTSVIKSTWDEAASRWIVDTDRGDVLRARFLVMAGGETFSPKLPGIPGIEDFEGHSFHNFRWDFDYTGGSNAGHLDKLSGKRVAVIGTGCSALQFVPHVAEAADELIVFQRTPTFILPRNNHDTEQSFLDSLEPGWQEARMRNFNALGENHPDAEHYDDNGFATYLGMLEEHAMSLVAKAQERGVELTTEELLEISNMDFMNDVRARVASIVEDPATAEALTPYYASWCKRAAWSDTYYQAFNRPNVRLVNVPQGVERITRNGVVAAGVEHEVDLIIYASGFEGATPSMWNVVRFPLEGRQGVTLADHWADSFKTMLRYCQDLWMRLFQAASCWSGEAVPGSTSSPFLKVAPART